MTAHGTDFLMPEVAAPAVEAPPATAAARWPRPVCRVFPGHAAQVPQARRFVRRVLAAGVFAAGGPVSDAALLTSELAANAVQHTASGRGGHFAVVIWPYPPGVRICVTDGGSVGGPAAALPAPGRLADPGLLAGPGPLADSGRGLAIVAALASRWGQQAGPSGRTVWFELAVPPVAAGHLPNAGLRPGP
jgi:anti-sigma regulatory factor (Ser/Thr protein kinase)